MSARSDETKNSSCKSQDPAEARASVTIQIAEEIQEALKMPTFSVWSVQDKEMLNLLEHMFYNLNLVAHFKMEAATLRQFLRSLQDHYRQNPFHNFRHGFCVTQMMYSIISLCGLQDLLPPEDVVTLIVAALCHDVDHPGLNNNYQVNARTELASRYQNKSPLENHHCAVTMEILSRTECDIFRNVAPEQARKILEGVAELILATDMALHPQILRSLQDVHSFSFSQEEHVALLKKGLIKLCDISNEARPVEEAELWADALMEEYFLQSDREKAEGLPVTPYMDRHTVTKAKSQRSFISFLLIPLCEALCQIFPQMTVWMLQPLQEARLRYERQTTEEMTSSL
ncbi:high affinity cGMP-specific 3',5'-cyclic phosphodiesterase 9A [Bufo gargarizans]|uniref:high affinity cGMP-specific 3',5'-cyclic phosphodiesterase 9A n=1 Tax=Bufo gargarizans TaxID=30331 RepID=UPI001CF4492F|nr:high affinity cGMP-specific 3',5'-cyclic phosphodiesterase 9A [Bufo gargarizans]